MGKKFAKKDPWAALPPGFKDAVAQMSRDEVGVRMRDVAYAFETEQQILKQDDKVVMAKDALKNLMQPYRESFKSYKAQIKYCKQIIDDKGGLSPAKQ